MVAPEQRKLKRFFVTLHNLSVLLFALRYHLSCLFSLLLYPQLNFLDHTEQSTTLRLLDKLSQTFSQLSCFNSHLLNDHVSSKVEAR